MEQRQAIRGAYGNVAAALADRSLGFSPPITAPEAQRGDPRDLDAYMFALFSINYKMRSKRAGGLPRF